MGISYQRLLSLYYCVFGCPPMIRIRVPLSIFFGLIVYGLIREQETKPNVHSSGSHYHLNHCALWAGVGHIASITPQDPPKLHDWG